MSGRVKLLAVLAAAVLLVGVFLLARLVQRSLEQDPPPTEPTIPPMTQGYNPNATIAPGFGPDEFPIIPVG